jgi:hypothetical protein
MKDFWGYDREVQPNGYIASSELATITIGDASRITLVQNVTATYTHMVSAKFESGSPTLFWLSGQPQGSITFSRLVGKEGFLASLSGLSGKCGSVVGVTLALNGTGGCSGSAATGGKSARFSGAIPESLNIAWQAGTLECQEGAGLKVATLDAA